MSSPHYMLQIDLLKGLAIISVLMLHTLPASILAASAFHFHIAQAVPIFIVLMSFSAYRSFGRKVEPTTHLLLDFYPRYLRERTIRYLVPLLVFILAVSAMLRYHLSAPPETMFNDLTSRMECLFNIPCYPLEGPGGYFLPLLFQLIIILPLMAQAYKHHPRLTLLATFVANLLFELSSTHMGFPYYHASVLRYMFLIPLSFIITDLQWIRSPNNRWVLIGFLVSVAYLLTITFLPPSTFANMTPDYAESILSFFYPVVLVSLCLRFLPQKSSERTTIWLAKIGQYSYYIYLAQMSLFYYFYQ